MPLQGTLKFLVLVSRRQFLIYSVTSILSMCKLIRRNLMLFNQALMNKYDYLFVLKSLSLTLEPQKRWFERTVSA